MLDDSNFSGHESCYNTLYTEKGLTIGYEGGSTINERTSMISGANTDSTDYRHEQYGYSADGYLDSVAIGEGTSAPIDRVTRTNNLVGNRIEQKEYNTDGSLADQTRYTYTADHQLVLEENTGSKNNFTIKT